MTRPAVVPLAEELWGELGPISQRDDEMTGWALLALCQALVGPLQFLEDIVRDSDTHIGYEAILDVDVCPPWALEWLGQFIGVRVTPGDPNDPDWVDRARTEIHATTGFQRGTIDAMVAAAQLTLTGTKTVQVSERSGGPGQLVVLTLAAETPDPVATERALRSQKAAGLVLTYAVSGDSPFINQGTLTIDAVGVAIDDATIDDVT